jgi:hypothetical protein
MKELIFCSLVIFLHSCTNHEVTIPKGVMSKSEMIRILSDIHIADAIAETKAQGGENERDLSSAYHVQILKNYKISKEEFETSFKFYESKPELMNEVYNSVQEEVSKREAELSKD